MKEFELEILNKIKEASKQVNFFSIKLEYNGKVILAKRDFPADKYSPETIQKTHLHFLLTDFSKKIQEELKKQDVWDKSNNESKEEKK
jgi:hypothetical protein